MVLSCRRDWGQECQERATGKSPLACGPTHSLAGPLEMQPTFASILHVAFHQNLISEPRRADVALLPINGHFWWAVTCSLAQGDR